MHQAEIIVLLFAAVAVLAVVACKLSAAVPHCAGDQRTRREFRAAIARSKT